jgi:hypothetical protein
MPMGGPKSITDVLLCPLPYSRGSVFPLPYSCGFVFRSLMVAALFSLDD